MVQKESIEGQIETAKIRIEKEHRQMVQIPTLETSSSMIDRMKQLKGEQKDSLVAYKD